MNENERFLTYMKSAADRCIETDAQTADHIPPCPVPTKTEQKIRKMLSSGVVSHDHRYTPMVWQKTAVACLVVCAVGLCIQPVRAALVGLITNGYDDHISVTFAVEEDSVYPTHIEEHIVPTTLPEGWTMEELSVDIASGVYVLYDIEGNVMYYEQRPYGGETWYDNTDITIQEMYLSNGYTGYLFNYEDGTMILTWLGKYEYTIMGYDITLDDLRIIADSIVE